MVDADVRLEVVERRRARVPLRVVLPCVTAIRAKPRRVSQTPPPLGVSSSSSSCAECVDLGESGSFGVCRGPSTVSFLCTCDTSGLLQVLTLWAVSTATRPAGCPTRGAPPAAARQHHLLKGTPVRVKDESSTLPPGGARVSGRGSALLGCRAPPGASPACRSAAATPTNQGDMGGGD